MLLRVSGEGWSPADPIATRAIPNIGTIPTLIGYAILCNSALTLIAAALVSGWFVLVPFAEEPWLRDRLGAAYEEYSSKVPRFLAFHRGRA